MPGRPPKPTLVLEMQGTKRKDRHGDRVDLGLSGITVQAPDWLSEEARAKWVELTTDSKYSKALAAVDGAMLAVFCDLWGRFVAGVKTPDDRLTPTETMVMVNLGAKLGLNPCDRTKLKMPEPEKPSSPWAKIRNTSNGA